MKELTESTCQGGSEEDYVLYSDWRRLYSVGCNEISYVLSDKTIIGVFFIGITYFGLTAECNVRLMQCEVI